MQIESELRRALRVVFTRYVVLCGLLVTNVIIAHVRSAVSGKRNFGSIEIDWDADPVMIKMSVRDIFGTTVSGTEVPLSILQPGALNTQPLQRGEVRRHCTLDVDLPWTRKYLLAYAFFGTSFGNTVCLVMICRSSVKKSSKFSD